MWSVREGLSERREGSYRLTALALLKQSRKRACSDSQCDI